MVGSMEESGGQPAAPQSGDEAADVVVAAAAMGESETISTRDSGGGGADDVMSTAEKIDDFFAEARRQQAAAHGDNADVYLELLQSTDQFTAVDFVTAYREGGVYPEDRLGELVLRFTDVRLQEWYLRFDAGMVNEKYYSRLAVDPSQTDTANPTLYLMAIAQSIIGRSRIAWEKLMRAVYFLETGGDLQPSGSRSYKAKFFAWVGTQPKWLFLAPYGDVVTAHDDRFRTGEFHKGSVLRRVIVGHEMPDLNEVMSLANYIQNVIWSNILDIVSGGWPTHFTDLHSRGEADMDIDPRYLPPGSDVTGQA